jgi:hypothetical protein
MIAVSLAKLTIVNLISMLCFQKVKNIKRRYRKCKSAVNNEAMYYIKIKAVYMQL